MKQNLYRTSTIVDESLSCFPRSRSEGILQNASLHENRSVYTDNSSSLIHFNAATGTLALLGTLEHLDRRTARCPLSTTTAASGHLNHFCNLFLSSLQPILLNAQTLKIALYIYFSIKGDGLFLFEP